MRTARDAKCASDPHVVSALRYGHKSRAVHRLAPADEVLGLPLRTYPDRIAFDRYSGRGKTRATLRRLWRRPCESSKLRTVNRPSMSFSHSGAVVISVIPHHRVSFERTAHGGERGEDWEARSL